MARFTDWLAASYGGEDYLVQFAYEEFLRRRVYWKIQRDLAVAGQDLGANQSTIETQIDALLTTFADQWFLYLFTGNTTQITTAITNDATLPWLDTEYPVGTGVDIRTRILNRFA